MPYVQFDHFAVAIFGDNGEKVKKLPYVGFAVISRASATHGFSVQVIGKLIVNDESTFRSEVKHIGILLALLLPVDIIAPLVLSTERRLHI